MRPDLVTIYAGGNNLMRPKLDLDALAAEYDEAIGKLAATGARILMWTAYDGSWAPVFGMLRGRWAVYNELVRAIADRHGATIVDFWRFDEYRDLRMWDFDRLHMSAAGHHNMAIRVLDLLGVAHGLGPVEFDEAPVLTRAQERAADRAWMREFLVPWVGRAAARGVLRRRHHPEIPRTRPCPVLTSRPSDLTLVPATAGTSVVVSGPSGRVVSGPSSRGEPDHVRDRLVLGLRR